MKNMSRKWFDLFFIIQSSVTVITTTVNDLINQCNTYLWKIYLEYLISDQLEVFPYTQYVVKDYWCLRSLTLSISVSMKKKPFKSNNMNIT